MTMSRAISARRRRTSPALIQRLTLNFQSRHKVVIVMTIASCLTDINAVCCQEKTLTFLHSRIPLIRPPSESHWCGRIRGMIAHEGFT